MQFHRLLRSSQAVAVASLVLTSGRTGVRPNSLDRPTQVTCINLKHAITFTLVRGIFNNHITKRLERGAYWSERNDLNGTYYRAPSGGIQFLRKDAKPGDKAMMVADGGFFLPNDPKKPIKAYTYNSSQRTPGKAQPEDLTCSKLQYTQDPSTRKISVSQMAVAGAVGGTLGGLTGRSISRNSTLSYGQSAGVGLAGGLLDGLIIAAINNANAGRLTLGKPVTDKTCSNPLWGWPGTR